MRGGAQSAGGTSFWAQGATLRRVVLGLDGPLVVFMDPSPCRSSGFQSSSYMCRDRTIEAASLAPRQARTSPCDPPHTSQTNRWDHLVRPCQWPVKKRSSNPAREHNKKRTRSRGVPLNQKAQPSPAEGSKAAENCAVPVFQSVPKAGR